MFPSYNMKCEYHRTKNVHSDNKGQLESCIANLTNPDESAGSAQVAVLAHERLLNENDTNILRSLLHHIMHN